MKTNIRHLFLIIILLSINLFVYSQNKLLTIDDIVTNRSIYPQGLKQIQWIDSTENYCYVASNILLKGSPLSSKTDTLLNLDRINSEFQKLHIETLINFPNIVKVTDGTVYFIHKNTLYIYDLNTHAFKSLNKYIKDAKNIDMEKFNYNIAYTYENNLYIAIKGKPIKITNDNNKDIVNGQAVHRNEFGIKKGTFWSPKSNYLAYYRMDQSMVTDYPIVNIEERPAKCEPIKYPMAGMKSHHVNIGVYDLKNQKTTFLETGEPLDQYLTNVTWSPDEKYIYVAILNREQNEMKLNKYDVLSGTFVSTLFTEKNDKYIEPLNGPEFLTDNSSRFIWQSQRDGYNHLYLYDGNGKLISQLTQGEWVVTDFLGFNRQSTKAFYIATTQSPLERQIYSVDVKTKATMQLTNEKGTHTGELSPNYQYIMDTYSSSTVPLKIDMLSWSGKITQNAYKAEDPLKEYKMPETVVFTIKADDNKTDLYCRMIKPKDFNQNNKYPVILYVYGGPHAQLITESWLSGAGLFLNYLAQNGYIVFTIDNRGSSYRGRDFEQAIFHNLGDLEIKDQMKGIEYLKRLSYVDPERIGVHGWSYGGFMAINLMLKHPEVFKVGVAGGPVIDWKYYEVMYGERYMGTPDNNPEGYKNANLLNNVKNLKGKLMLIQGDVDPVVVWQHSLMFIKKCVDEDIPVDYFVYPEQEHNVIGKNRGHLYKKIDSYFKQNLY